MKETRRDDIVDELRPIVVISMDIFRIILGRRWENDFSEFTISSGA
jgi:hypothetical protein